MTQFIHEPVRLNDFICDLGSFALKHPNNPRLCVHVDISSEIAHYFRAAEKRRGSPLSEVEQQAVMDFAGALNNFYAVTGKLLTIANYQEPTAKFLEVKPLVYKLARDEDET